MSSTYVLFCDPYDIVTCREKQYSMKIIQGKLLWKYRGRRYCPCVLHLFLIITPYKRRRAFEGVKSYRLFVLPLSVCLEQLRVALNASTFTARAKTLSLSSCWDMYLCTWLFWHKKSLHLNPDWSYFLANVLPKVKMNTF